MQDLDEPLAGTGWTLPGLLDARSRMTPSSPALWQRSPVGQWESTSWEDYRKACASIASGFIRLGVKPGDRVAIMAPSCKEWDYAQIGILATGGVAVGFDLHAIDEHTRAMAQQCRPIGWILGNPAVLDKLGSLIDEQTRFIVFIDPGSDTAAISLNALMKGPVHDGYWNQAQPDAAATLIYTSGTTGEPKGIEYTHRQVCLAVSSILSAFPDITEGSHLACWLPLSNLFQRMINLCAMGRGAQTFYVPDPRDIMRLVPEISPHVFIGVPRFYEKLYAGIQETIARQSAWKQAVVRWALRVGDQNAAAVRAGKSAPSSSTPTRMLSRLRWGLAKRLGLNKLRHVLGDNLRFMMSGSAPMPAWLLERFHAMGLPILEAYGLSENIIPVALNRPDRFRFGTVGQALPGCEVKLAQDGELLVRGPGVFRKYLGETDNDRIDGNGFLMSGDYATLDDDGFITLVGRKSEIFKTSTGRRVAPTLIEGLLRQVPGVEFAAIFGAGRTVPMALLAVNETTWKVPGDQLAARLSTEVSRVLVVLPSYLRPAGIAVTNRMPTIAGGELTANLKPRRREIQTRFADTLAELCAHLDEANGSPFKTRSKDGLVLFIGL